MKRLAGEYEKATGLDPKKEHGKWNIVGKTLLGAGIPLIIQAGRRSGRDLRKRATFVATPWKFEHGDACIVRFVAMVDPNGTCRIDSGKA